MPRRGMNAYKRKDGRWEGRYIKGHSPNGRAIYGYVYAKTYALVKDKLLQYQTNPPQDSPKGRRTTFGQVAEMWLSRSMIQVKPSTHTRYMEAMHLHILPELGALLLEEMTEERIAQFAKEKMLSGRVDRRGGLSAQTVRDLLSRIKAVMGYAKAQGYVVHPAEIHYPMKTKREMRVLSREEQDTLEKLLLDEMDLPQLATLCCLYTGLRVGEICALQWQDVSFDEGVIYVRRTSQRIKNMENSTTKTAVIVDVPKSRTSMRVVPLPTFLKMHLKHFQGAEQEYIFSMQKNRPAVLRTVQNWFRRQLVQADIQQANFHALRHTFATRCVEAGVDVKALSEMLGHSSVNTTLNLYVHSSMEHKRACIDRLMNYMTA